jgi:predicted GTPase
VNSPFLKNLAIIDTPGMLDSIAERDRGYNYQEVIGDLAQIADLVLILFDPHKPRTVREAHTSLRDTLPDRTFEDRILFVLNRIDECASLMDLLQVYGTLCWNLSQMTGRKDIPTIHLVYSPQAAHASANGAKADTGLLFHL